MRLMHPAFSIPIVFDENRINVLAVESRPLFRDMLSDLYRQQHGDSGDFVLSKNFVPVQINRELELIREPVFLDCNQKRLMSKILSGLERAAMGEEMFIETRSIQSALLAYFEKLLFLSDIPLRIENEVALPVLIKAAGISVDDRERPVPERMIDYLDILTDLEIAKCFVFVNLKSYLSLDEMLLLYDNLKYKKYHVLLLESCFWDTLREMEKTVLIDEDQCEVMNENDAKL